MHSKWMEEINKQEKIPLIGVRNKRVKETGEKNIQRDSERISDREAAERWLMQNGTVSKLVKWLLCAEWRCSRGRITHDHRAQSNPYHLLVG